MSSSSTDPAGPTGAAALRVDPARVREAVEARRDAILARLRTIVNMDSPTESKEHVDRVGTVLEAWLTEAGFAVERRPQERYGDHLVATRPGDAGRPRVLLVGHFDTVHPEGAAAARPFTIDGERAYGPGVLDMKGGLVVGLAAVEVLDAVLPDHGLRLDFVMNADEEPGSPTSRELIERLAPRCDVALVLEPGFPGASVTTGRKGVGIFDVTVTGRAAHAGREPESGASAIHELAHLITALADTADPEAGTTVNVGVIEGGTHPYVVAPQARASVDVRVATLAEERRIREAFAAIVASTHLSGTSTELAGGFHRPPFTSHERDPLWHLAHGLGPHVGLELVRTVSGGASDANNIAAQGVSTLDGLGPDGYGAHTTDEHIVLASLFQKVGLNALLLAGLSSTEGQGGSASPS